MNWLDYISERWRLDWEFFAAEWPWLLAIMAGLVGTLVVLRIVCARIDSKAWRKVK